MRLNSGSRFAEGRLGPLHIPALVVQSIASDAHLLPEEKIYPQRQNYQGNERRMAERRMSSESCCRCSNAIARPGTGTGVGRAETIPRRLGRVWRGHESADRSQRGRCRCGSPPLFFITTRRRSWPRRKRETGAVRVYLPIVTEISP